MLGPRLLIVGCLLGAAHAAWAQTWVRTYGGLGQDEAVTPAQSADGGLIVAGTTSSQGAGSQDVVVLRLDRCGEPLWMKTYGGAFDESARALAPTAAGDWLVAGDSSSFDSSLDYWVLKLSAAGTILWQRRFGGAGDETAHAIEATSDGGCLVAGVAQGPGGGDQDGWIMKLDASGSPIWQKTLGGAGDDLVEDVLVTADGGYLLVGSTDSWGAGFFDLWIIKLGSTGGLVWQKTLGGPSDEAAHAVAQRPDGTFLVAGFTDSFGAGLLDYWVLALDTQGAILWQNTYGGVDDDEATAVLAASGGVSIVSGQTFSAGAGLSDAWLIALDSAGQILWQKTYGGPAEDAVRSSAVAMEGGIIAAGLTASFGQGASDAWLLRLDMAGEMRASCTIDATTSAAPVGSSAAVQQAQISVVTTSVPHRETSGSSAAALLSYVEPCLATPGEVSPPWSPQPLVFTGRNTLQWEDAAGSCSSSFNLYRGDVALDLPAEVYGTCLDSPVPSATAQDFELPAAAGSCWFYLVTGVRAGVEGTLGHDSAGNLRPNGSPCP